MSGDKCFPVFSWWVWPLVSGCRCEGRRAVPMDALIDCSWHFRHLLRHAQIAESPKLIWQEINTLRNQLSSVSAASRYGNREREGLWNHVLWEATWRSAVVAHAPQTYRSFGSFVRSVWWSLHWFCNRELRFCRCWGIFDQRSIGNGELVWISTGEKAPQPRSASACRDFAGECFCIWLVSWQTI